MVDLPLLQHPHILLFAVINVFLPTVVLEHIIGYCLVIDPVVPASPDKDVPLKHGIEFLLQWLVVIQIISSILYLIGLHLLELIFELLF